MKTSPQMISGKHLTHINWFHLWVPIKWFMDTFMWFIESTNSIGPGKSYGPYDMAHMIQLRLCLLSRPGQPWTSLSTLVHHDCLLSSGCWNISYETYDMVHTKCFDIELDFKKLKPHVKYDLTCLMNKLDLWRNFGSQYVTQLQYGPYWMASDPKFTVNHFNWAMSYSLHWVHPMCNT